MKIRIPIAKIYPKAFQALIALDQTIRESEIDKWHQELIKIRASQLNGCAYCLDKHAQDALALGINARKINVIATWREALSHFTDQEQLILQLTEEVTLISNHGLSDETFDKCIILFGEALTAELIFATTVINAWNRIGVGFKMEPSF